MIDITNAKNEFNKYVANYDPTNGRIKLKQDHILRVAEICKNIAIDLNLSEDEIKVAELIGLFHDLGRFEQVRLFNTYNDKICGIDHADFSNKVLFENNFIRKFISDDSYDEIIKKAVFNHNKLHIEDGLSEKELLFAKIIRDADKLDIIYTSTCYEFADVFWYKEFDVEKINEQIVENFAQTKLLEYKYVKTNADQSMCFFSYIYDLYFEYSMKYLKNTKLLETFVQRIKEVFPSPIIHSQIDRVLIIANNYLNEHIKN